MNILSMGVKSVHPLDGMNQKLSIKSTKSTTSIPIAPQLHQETSILLTGLAARFFHFSSTFYGHSHQRKFYFTRKISPGILLGTDQTADRYASIDDYAHLLILSNFFDIGSDFFLAAFSFKFSCQHS